MAGFMHFLNCLGKAVVKNGCRVLVSMVPGGEAIWEIANGTLEEYRKSGTEAGLKGEIENLAQAPVAEVHEAAQQAAAVAQPEDRLELAAYLASVQSSIRRSMRRISDPSGGTIPAGRSMRTPGDLVPLLPAGMPRFRPGDRPLSADYELVEMLGKGGFGEVWKARHLTRSRQRPVALKFCLDPEAAQSLRNEAVLHDELDRVREEGAANGFVPLLETFLRADPPCLMYELIEGGDLAGLIEDRLAQGLLTPEFAAETVGRLASIMAGPHRMSPPLVHRDLKPSNVLVRRGEGDAVSFFVADLGIGGLAARQALKEEAERRTACSVSIPAGVRGAYTPLYASPQQMRGERPDPRDDVHALGVLWYQMVVGDLGLLSIPPDWREVAEDRGTPPELLPLLAACLASQSERRPADAAELAECLTLRPRNHPVDVQRQTNQEASPVVVPRRSERTICEEQGEVRPGQIVQLGIQGTLRQKASGHQDNSWGGPQSLPAAVVVREGFEYWVQLRKDATEADLEKVVEFGRHAPLSEIDVFDGGWLTDKGLMLLKELTSLRELSLFSCESFTDAGLISIAALPSLETLALVGASITGEGLRHLQQLAHLKVVDLCGCALLVDHGLSNLQNLRSLSHLDISGCKSLSTECLPLIQNFSYLISLSLYESEWVTDDGLAHVGRCHNLQWLMLGECPRITDDGLRHLKDLRSLQYLDLLRCNQLTDAGLVHLASIPSLRALDTSGCCGLTQAGIAWLKGALPHCEIKPSVS